MSGVSVAAAVWPDKPKKLLDRVRDVMRLKHYSLRTERCYRDCVRRFVRALSGEA